MGHPVTSREMRMNTKQFIDNDAYDGKLQIMKTPETSEKQPKKKPEINCSHSWKHGAYAPPFPPLVDSTTMPRWMATSWQRPSRGAAAAFLRSYTFLFGTIFCIRKPMQWQF